MPSLTIPALPEELERRLQQLAEQNQTTPEIEALIIIDRALCPEARVGMGTALHEWGQRLRAAGYELNLKPAPAVSGPIAAE